MSSEVERWLQRQAVREGRGILLEEALLGDRLWDYTRYRLRFFFLKYLVETAVHTVTVLLLFSELGWSAFLPVVVAFSATSLVSNFWFGALEALRSAVRDLHRSGKPHVIPRLIGGWLTFAGLLGLVVVALALAWTGWNLFNGGLGAAEAFVTVLLLRLAVDLPTRTYHSGVYALRRVYKPPVIVVGSQVVELAIIAALVGAIGLWSLVVASVLLTVLLTGATLLYTGRVYHFIGADPLAEVRLGGIGAALRDRWGEFWQAGAANAAIALDSVVVLAVLSTAAPDSPALVVLFLAGPSIKAAADWARLFYFDLKRLELQLFANLRRRFEAHTHTLAWLLGGTFWLAAVLVTLLLADEGVAVPFVALGVFFLARSLLARVQVQAFADGSYRPVLGTGAVLVAGLALARVTIDSDELLLGAVGVVTAVVAWLLSRLRRQAVSRGATGEGLLTLDWLHELGSRRTPLRLGSATVVAGTGPEVLDTRTREERTRWRLAQLADGAARELGGRGATAWVEPNVLVWFEPTDQEPIITARWLQVASGGLVSGVGVHECANGEEALHVAGRGRLLGDASAHLLRAVLPVDVADARARFADLVPDGVVYAPDGPVPDLLAGLPGHELKAVLIDAVSFARNLRVRRRRSPLDVTALCAGGELRLIFAAPLRGNQRRRARWRREVTRMNVHGAVGGARAGPPRSGRAFTTDRVRLPVWVTRRLDRRRQAGHPERVSALRQVPLLSQLTDRELAMVADAMTTRTFAAGEAVTQQGKQGVGFFVIATGRTEVTVNGQQVRRLGPGDHFGELALIAETPRTATVTALEELVCHRMVSWEFRRLVESSAAISWHVLQATARILQQTQALDPLLPDLEPRQDLHSTTSDPTVGRNERAAGEQAATRG